MRSPDRVSDPQLPRLVAEFYRGVERQRRRDAEAVAGLARELKAGRAGKLVELLREMVGQRADQQLCASQGDKHGF